MKRRKVDEAWFVWWKAAQKVLRYGNHGDARKHHQEAARRNRFVSVVSPDLRGVEPGGDGVKRQGTPLSKSVAFLRPRCSIGLPGQVPPHTRSAPCSGSPARLIAVSPLVSVLLLGIPAHGRRSGIRARPRPHAAGDPGDRFHQRARTRGRTSP